MKESRGKLLKVRKLKSLKIEEQINFLFDLEQLIENGYSFSESIKLISYKLENHMYLDKLKKGYTLSKTLKTLGYDNDVLLLVELGERTGQLFTSLSKSLELLQQKKNNKSNIIDEIKYPFFLGGVVLVILFFISNFLLPSFMNVYESFDIEISIFVNILFLLIKYIPIIFLSIGMVTILSILYIKSKEAGAKLNLLTKYSFIRTRYYKIYNQIFAYNLSLLLNLDLNYKDIFLILKNQKHNYLLSKESEIIYNKLAKGEKLSSILKNQKKYDNSFIQTIENGENNNLLKESLNKYLIISKKLKKKKQERILALIQPIFYMLLGLIIVLVYASIFIPLFKVMDQL